MSVLPPRPLPPVVLLSLPVRDGVVSVEILSLIPPRVWGGGAQRVCCGGVLRTLGRVESDDVPVKDSWKYAVVCGRYTGKWGFPKGKREAGESELECALREVAEEVGVGGLSAPVRRIPIAGQVYFVFDVAEELPLCPVDILEISETRWVGLEEMKGLPANAGIRGFVERMERMKR